MKKETERDRKMNIILIQFKKNMRKKARNLFAFALATVAFTACSNDNDVVGGGDNGEVTAGMVEQIGICFAGSASTYADNGIKEGEGTENNVYKAFIFAHETDATGLMPGDWSVKEVGDGTAAISATTSDGNPSLSKMATFSRVTMGENVYVLVNVPGLTKAQAEVIAHKGVNSEQSIKEFVYNVSKEYLNGLVYKNDEAPVGKFVMAGMATIPTNPTTPNGQTVTVPVELNREMAKVHFQALVTADNTKEAFGKVEIKEADGIIIARVARKFSPFTKWERDWYFPLNATASTDMDWGYNGANVDEWKVAFNGDTKDTPSTAVVGFNGAVSKESAVEYRYTWTHTSGGNLTITDGKLQSPYFYVSPNYAGNANCVSVICTQATYTGAPVFADADANTLFVKAYSKYIDGQETSFKDADGNNAATFGACVWTDAAMGVVSTYFTSDHSADADLQNWTGLSAPEITAAADIIKTVTQVGTANASLSYYTGQKVYYRADIANYDAATGSVSNNLTERNTYCQIEGTITSLGAPSIDDAINSDNISMLVKVKVLPWKWVVNRVDM